MEVLGLKYLSVFLVKRFKFETDQKHVSRHFEDQEKQLVTFSEVHYGLRSVQALHVYTLIS